MNRSLVSLTSRAAKVTQTMSQKQTPELNKTVTKQHSSLLGLHTEGYSLAGWQTAKDLKEQEHGQHVHAWVAQEQCACSQRISRAAKQGRVWEARRWVLSQCYIELSHLLSIPQHLPLAATCSVPDNTEVPRPHLRKTIQC